MKTTLTIPQKILRGLLILLLILAAGTAGFATVTVVKYRQSATSPEKASIEQPVRLSAERDVPIGRNIDFSAELRIPWGRTPASLDVRTGEGSQLSGPPVLRRERIGWGYTLWEIRGSLHAFRPGEIPAGSVEAVVEGGAEKKQNLSLTLPAFRSRALTVSGGDKLEIAGRIPESAEAENRTVPVVLAVGILILLALVLWILLRRRGAKRALLPPWDLALESIGAIRSDLHGGKADAALAIMRLTDVIRSYLEQRFHLRAEHQTTREFLDEIRSGGPLEEKQRSFLKEFLASADMVKFAKAPADTMAFDEAALRAETLVRETAVKEENGKESAV